MQGAGDESLRVREIAPGIGSCRARLQAGTVESSRCPPEGGRYKYEPMLSSGMNSKLAVGWPVPSAIRPSLFCEVGQVVRPVVFLHAARINHVCQIVLRVG